VSSTAAAVVFVTTIDDGRSSLVWERSDGRAVAGLTVDRVGATLALLAVGVGLVAQSFARRGLDGDPRARRFFVLAGLLTGSTALVALAATGTGLAVGWAVTGWALAGLVGHRVEWRPARHAARLTRRNLLVGDVALLAAVVFALATIGDLDLRRVGVDASLLGDRSISGSSSLAVVAVLLAVAGISRSALVPMHRWLPSSIAAPTPVSAMLHAGVVNGAGVLFVRFAPLVATSTVAMWTIFVAGVVTALLATSVMLVRSDVKGGLAWSTAGQMGFMAVQLGVGAFAAALFHLVGHAMYKAALFLGAGGAIEAHARARHLPRAQRSLARSIRLVIAAVVPTGATALAFVWFDPHTGTAGALLIIVFGSLSGARLLNGWLRTAWMSPAMLLLGVGAGAIAGAGYVAGVTAFERFVAGSLPVAVDTGVGAVPLTIVLALVTAGAVAIGFVAGSNRTSWRRRVYAALLGFGTAPSRARDRLEPRPVADPADRPLIGIAVGHLDRIQAG
jgi:NADH:ubiquinone oxidoreductase subunit 5 (subunit L)/multisubunit Na+/H+ antiporter MnhA subunit